MLFGLSKKPHGENKIMGRENKSLFLIDRNDYINNVKKGGTHIDLVAFKPFFKGVGQTCSALHKVFRANLCITESMTHLSLGSPGHSLGVLHRYLKR